VRARALIAGLLALSGVFAPQARAAHAYAQFGDIKYPPGFSHFDWANPNAPKGGDIELVPPLRITNFDKYNPFTLKGTAPPGLTALVFESLLTGTFDEPSTGYGLLAEDVEVARDRMSVSFRLNPRARFHDGTPVTADDLKVAGSMAVLLKDALKPNLLQTLEGGPAFVHAGPFGNIAHGNNSILADRIALVTNDIVCTEAGFGADMGAEKFFDIKCRASGLRPDAGVIVATVRALKMHGGVGRIVAGKPLDPALLEANAEAVRRGAVNLAKQVENVTTFGIPAVVAINAFPTDDPAEYDAIREVALGAGARAAVVTRNFAEGGAGAMDLAAAVWEAAGAGESDYAPLYPDEMPLVEKIETIATRIYGADGIDLLPAAAKQLARMESIGYGHLPICVAKTQYSLSHDPALLGRPTGFRVPIREARLNAGAGFVTAMAGEMRMMPGLPSRPGGENIDIDADGNIVGLF